MISSNIVSNRGRFPSSCPFKRQECRKCFVKTIELFGHGLLLIVLYVLTALLAVIVNSLNWILISERLSLLESLFIRSKLLKMTAVRVDETYSKNNRQWPNSPLAYTTHGHERWM